MVRIHRVTFVAAVLGNGSSALRRPSPSMSLFIPNHVGRSWSADDVSRRSPSTISRRCWTIGKYCTGYIECNLFPSKKTHCLWSRIMVSAVSHSQEVLNISATTTNVNSGANDDGSDEQEDDSMEDSRSSLLINALTVSIQSAFQKISKKNRSLQRELTKAQSLEGIVKRANLIVSNLYRLPPGTQSAEVEDWEKDGKIVELVLNTKDYRGAQEEADALFALARKMKRGSKVVKDLLEKSLRGEEILKKAMMDLESLVDNDVMLDEGILLLQEQLECTSRITGFQSPRLNENNETTQKLQRNQMIKRNSAKARNKPNPRELTSPSGHKVLVGRNRRDNEAICFQLSKPTDIWMHSRGCPGAHVLLCVRRGSPEVTDEDLQFAADLASFYSDARTELRAKITTAEPKHITKPRGAPMGAVSLRKEGKTLLGRPGDVSDDLKEAREESGMAWDEMGYRKLGLRSKNKKKTAAVDKAMREQNREEAKHKNKRRNRKEEQSWY